MKSNNDADRPAPANGTGPRRRVNVFRALLSSAVYAAVLICAVGLSGNVPFLLLLVPLMIVADRVMDRFCDVKPERMQLTRIPTAALPRRAQEYFEMHTPEFLQAGFRLLGDFRVKPKTAHFARFFVNELGTIFGEISSLPTIGTSIQSCSVFSVTDELVYIEVGKFATSQRPSPTHTSYSKGYRARVWAKCCITARRLSPSMLLQIRKSLSAMTNCQWFVCMDRRSSTRLWSMKVWREGTPIAMSTWRPCPGALSSPCSLSVHLGQFAQLTCRLACDLLVRFVRDVHQTHDHLVAFADLVVRDEELKIPSRVLVATARR